MHCRRAPTPWHATLSGVHIHAAQTPMLQVCIDPQGAVVLPSPSALHVRTVLPSQLRVPGTQTQPAHMLVAGSHAFIAGHAIGAAYSSPSSLHRRTEVVPTHDVAPGEQTCGMHTPARQLCAAGHASAL